MRQFLRIFILTFLDKCLNFKRIRKVQNLFHGNNQNITVTEILVLNFKPSSECCKRTGNNSRALMGDREILGHRCSINLGLYCSDYLWENLSCSFKDFEPCICFRGQKPQEAILADFHILFLNS